MDAQRYKLRQRFRRRMRVRKPLRRRPDRPRLSVFRSHQNIYAQIIDDYQGKTLCAASTVEKDLKEQVGYGGNKEAAAAVGKALAQRAVEKGITEVTFDRGNYKYHGRLAALADAAREGGLQF